MTSDWHANKLLPVQSAWPLSSSPYSYNVRLICLFHKERYIHIPRHLTKLCTITRCIQMEIRTATAVIKLIHFGFHKYDPWLLVVSGRAGQSAADTWNDWESAACSHYLVPCIVIITPALSAPLLPSLLAIVIVIDWCGSQNSGVWKGIRHTSHNRPAIWSSPPPIHWLLIHLSILLLFFSLRLKGSGS